MKLSSVVAALVVFTRVSIGLANDKAAQEHRWDLRQIYSSDAHWKSAQQRLLRRVDALDMFSGHLGDDPGTLAAAMENLFDINRELGRVYSYASMKSDEDTRVASTLEMKDQAFAVHTALAQKAAFFEPQILGLGRERADTFLGEEPRLEPFGHYIDNILRLAPHTLDAKGEKLVATTYRMADTASDLYEILSYADIPWPEVELSDGTRVRLDQAAYTRYRGAANRHDRKRVFDAFWGKWKEYERTFGVALSSQVKKDIVYKQIRDYPSCLSHALSVDNVPEQVYRALLKAANGNLGTLHRYLKLRQRMLGLEELRYHDLYTPLVSSKETYPIGRAKELLTVALAPLGEDYAAAMRKGFADRWMDVYPGQGKRSGAYSNDAAYDVHPYVLMNYNDDYESVSTMAHEWGHAMHSYLASSTQPYATADYAIFVAEVASTFNEALLLDHMLTEAKSDDEKLYFLGSALENLRQTFFRQAMFAEFELDIHERVEKGESLSGETLTKIYGDLLKRYHGHDEKVTIIDDAYAIEWAYIPHFYYGFYVYKYATSLAASALFAQAVVEGKEGARDQFVDVLKAGGSQYPYELLKDAGVDLSSMQPYEALVARMNAIMDRIEGLLDRRGR